MVKCPDCGKELGWFEDYCQKCGAPRPKEPALGGAVSSAMPPSPKGDPLTPLEREVRVIRLEARARASGLTAVFSALLPGLGQVYAGQITAGAVMILAWVLGTGLYVRWVLETLARPMSRWQAGSRFGPGHALAGVAVILFWIIAIAHAAKAAREMKVG